ncbi:TPA: type 1 fimbrial protein [Enterobacter asburiae]|nr:type 1 fimbrial protein [Enterobacter asburiae]
MSQKLLTLLFLTFFAKFSYANYCGPFTDRIPVTNSNITIKGNVILLPSPHYDCALQPGGPVYERYWTDTALLNSAITSQAGVGFMTYENQTFESPFPSKNFCLTFANETNGGCNLSYPSYQVVKGNTHFLPGIRFPGNLKPRLTGVSGLDAVVLNGFYESCGPSGCSRSNVKYTWYLAEDIVVSSCVVQNPDITVPLKETSVKELMGATNGTVFGGNFSVVLQCDPGVSASIQFDGNTIPNYNSILQASVDGNIGDVGIEIKYNDIPLIFGTPINVVSGASGTESIPFSAHYALVPGGNVKVGSLNAVANFTMAYF